MNIRDIINALRESPYWTMLPLNEREALVLHSAQMVASRKMENILKFITAI
ncbi:MAG TPA: hypothetical protein VK448_10980 [Dissulfurispiraceae bacterium]|nr:hypothetical protein [Dissulfurispiraceae bacterium]